VLTVRKDRAESHLVQDAELLQSSESTVQLPE